MSRLLVRSAVCAVIATAGGCGRIGYQSSGESDSASGSDGNSGVGEDGGIDPGALPTASLLNVEHLGGAGLDLCYSLAMNETGRHVVTGHFSDTASLGAEELSSQGSTDIFLAVWDGDAAPVSSVAYGGSGGQGGNGVAIDDRGQVFSTGGTRESIDLGAGPLPFEGEGDIYAFSVDADNVHQWSMAGGSSMDEFGHDVATDGSGGSAIAGNLRGAGTVGGSSLESIGGMDALVLRVDSDGSILWNAVLGGEGDDEATGVALLPDGSVVAAGGFSGSVDFGGGPRETSGTAGFVVSLGSGGDYQWDAVIEGSGADYIYGIGSDAAGNVYVTGEFSTGASIAGVNLAPADDRDGFAASFTADGELRWVITLGGGGVDVFHDVAARDGIAYIAGYFTETSVLFPEAPEPPLFRDGFVLAVDAGDGGLLWKNRLAEVTAVGVGADGAGTVAVAGYFRDPADFGDDVVLSPRGSIDVFVARYRRE